MIPQLDWGLSAVIIFGMLLALIATGMPVSLAMIATVTVGIMLFVGPQGLIIIPQIVSEKAADQLFSVIPLFVMMAVVAAGSGITEKAFGAGMAWFGRLPGALAVSSQASATVFAAVSGSSPATAAAVGYFAIPEMTKNGYSKSFAVGAVAAGGTLGILIPPSVAMIIFGLTTETSIGALFVAGILPGIIMACLLVLYVIAAAKLNPELAPGTTRRYTWRERFGSLSGLWPIGVLFIAVIGSIYTGIATPSEAASVGAVGALIIALATRTITVRKLFSSLRDAAEATAMVLMLVIGGFGLSFLFARVGIARGVGGLVTEASISPWAVLIFMIIVLLLLGTVLDPVSLIVIAMPLFFPVLMTLGFDPIWIGVIVTVAVEIGMITPPVGLNVLILRNAVPGGARMGELFRGILPFVGVLLVGLVIIVLVPGISTWLPSLMID